MRTGVTAGLVQANVVDWSYFIRFDFGGGTGTLRFTDRYSGDYTGNIDGAGSLLWTYSGFDVGPLDQSTNNPDSVSWLRFPNLDYFWTNLASTPGIRNIPVQVWRGQFDATGTLTDKWKAYQGVCDDHTISASFQVTLKPGTTPWAKALPAQIIGPLCLYKYRDPQTCQYAGAEPGGETTCNKTRSDCALRANQAHFGGFDLMPAPGTKISWGDSSSEF
jgi:hypothetical protein